MLAKILTICLLVAASNAWMTNWDQHFKFSCPQDQMLKSIESRHDNGKEDRVFNFGCADLPDSTNLTDCEWSGYMNDYDKPLRFQCPGNRIITGVESVHDNGKEDRRYSFRCCQAASLIAHACRYTNMVNDWDASFRYRVSDGWAFKGVSSFHDNKKEDRRFRFNVCKLSAILDNLEESGIKRSLITLGELYEGSVKVDVTIAKPENDTSEQNMALASNSLTQAIGGGGLDIEINGTKIPLDPTTEIKPRTASEVGSPDSTTTATPGPVTIPADDDDDDGLSKTEKIIIGAVGGAVGLLVLFVISYCMCCRNKQKDEPMDDTFNHVRIAQRTQDAVYDKPALYNPAFEEDGHYMKIKV